MVRYSSRLRNPPRSNQARNRDSPSDLDEIALPRRSVTARLRPPGEAESRIRNCPGRLCDSLYSRSPVWLRITSSMPSPSTQALHVKTGLERLLEELTAFADVMAEWDGVHPPPSYMADRIREVERRLSRAENRLRELRSDPDAACQDDR